jgi:hypothetical protein
MGATCQGGCTSDQAEALTRECAARAAASSVPAHLRPNISTHPARSITCEEAFVLFHVISSSAPAKGSRQSCGGLGDDGGSGARAPAAPLQDAGKAWGCSHVVVGGVKYFVLFADGRSCLVCLSARSCSCRCFIGLRTTVPPRASSCPVACCTWSRCLAGLWVIAAPDVRIVDQRLPMCVLTVKTIACPFSHRDVHGGDFERGRAMCVRFDLEGAVGFHL